MTTELLSCVELESGPSPRHSVIWLHGLGADGNDFVPMVEELTLPVDPVRFVFPHAPMQPVTINGGYVMRAWYDIISHDLTAREDEKGVRDSQHAIERLIEREESRGSPAKNIVVVGFSQGGAIALQAGLRFPRRLAGVAALSAYLPLSSTLPAELAPANRGASVLMAHGSEDPVVPVSLAQQSRDDLQELGLKVQWHVYPMLHGVCAEEIRDIETWLRQVLEA